VKDYVGGDDCAEARSWVTPDKPKGSVCVMESGPGAYCTHECKTNPDCQDLVRDAFIGECSGGLCLLSKK